MIIQVCIHRHYNVIYKWNMSVIDITCSTEGWRLTGIDRGCSSCISHIDSHRCSKSVNTVMLPMARADDPLSSEWVPLCCRWLMQTFRFKAAGYRADADDSRRWPANAERDRSAVKHRFQANARDGAICRSRVKRLQNRSIEENEAQIFSVLTIWNHLWWKINESKCFQNDDI